MKPNPKVLWFGPGAPMSPDVRTALQSDFDLQSARSAQELSLHINDVPLAVIAPNGQAKDPHALGKMLDELEESRAIVMFLLPPEARAAWRQIESRRGRFLCVSDAAGAAELTAKLQAALELQPAIGRLQEALGVALDQSSGSTKLLEEMDEQMRLAARLQRDFLPRRLPEVGGGRFAVLYQPATWVSGDLYDVARLDETHVGFYVADVVGHGMPAALLTMFIKKALQTKRIVGNTYQIVPPDVAMEELNTDICEQNLSSAQFCTAVYCIFDSEALTLSYCRAGHPEPILYSPSGRSRRLDGKGPLLGIFEQETFQCHQVQLEPGDRLVLYTDGAEDGLRPRLEAPGEPLERYLQPWADKPRDELLLRLAAQLEAIQGTAPPQDDVTVLVLDIEG